MVLELPMHYLHWTLWGPIPLSKTNMDLTGSKMEVAFQPLPGRGKYKSVGAKRVHVQSYPGLRSCISVGPVALLMLVVTASGVTGVSGATNVVLSSGRWHRPQWYRIIRTSATGGEHSSLMRSHILGSSGVLTAVHMPRASALISICQSRAHTQRYGTPISRSRKYWAWERRWTQGHQCLHLHQK